MPCLSTGYDDEPCGLVSRNAQLEGDIARLEAALCAALTFIENQSSLTKFYSETNWKEAGITKEKVASWWVSHKKKDSIRRAREEKERKAAIECKSRVRELSKKAWKDLSLSERRFLNNYPDGEESSEGN